jgi:hypothetical protein
MRHPFYCSYMIPYLSGLMATMNFLLLPVVIGMKRFTPGRHARRKPSFQPVHSVTDTRSIKSEPGYSPRGSSGASGTIAADRTPRRRTRPTLLKRAGPTAFLGRVGELRTSSSKVHRYDRSKTDTNEE